MAENTTFKLQIMASDHMVFDGDAQSVSLPTTEGSVGILADHSNVIMAVIPGLLEYTAERPEDIDEARAKRAEEKAREELKRANSNRDHAMVEAELSRALSRIKASKSRHTL